MAIRYYVPCTLGLEPILADELRALGVGDVHPAHGGVAFAGDRRAGYAANLWLRTAVRVQEEIATAWARDEKALYRAVRDIDWSPYLTPGHTLAVDASVRSSGVTHSKYAALVVKDAIVDQLRERHGERPSVDTEAPDLPLKVTLLRNKLTVYRNMSGVSLHKRGWRPVQVKSPLNEALAAGLLMLTDWDRNSDLVDPMCGSGTLLIEAAHLAMDRAPGLERMFPFETWPDFDAALWQELRGDAEARVRTSLPFALEGADRHPGAIALARKAAAAAGVADLVRFTVSDARDFEPRCTPKQVVTNPPYGERLGEGEDLRDSWTALGNFLHGQCRGATAHVLSGNRDLPRLLGLRVGRKIPVRNASIDCRWLRYEIGAERRPRHEASPQTG